MNTPAGARAVVLKSIPNWPGIIRDNWRSEPIVIQAANSWINEELENVEARHRVMEYALRRYKFLRKQETAGADHEFTTDLGVMIDFEKSPDS